MKVTENFGNIHSVKKSEIRFLKKKYGAVEKSGGCNLSKS